MGEPLPSPGRRPGRPGAFTLIELLVVVVILSGVLLLVPPNLFVFGARSRLDDSANTIVAAIALAREEAIMDGYPVRIEFGTWENRDGDSFYGHRFVFTSEPVRRSTLLDEEGEERSRAPRGEREWLTTMWRPTSRGVRIVGVSEEENEWKEIDEDRPYSISFGPDGSVEKGFALRLASEDLDTEERHRTITILVNHLTSEPTAHDGMKEMPPRRHETEMRK